MRGPWRRRSANADWPAESNPWWEDPGAIRADAHIRAWEASSARYNPSAFWDIRASLDAESRMLYTVHGSRQVGKTTLLKLLVRDLLDRGTRPADICYLALGPGFAAMDLKQAISDYALLTQPCRGAGRLYILVDEISLVTGWQHAILSLSNMGALPNCALALAGSNAIDLTRGTESLVGRKGMVEGGSHRSLLPMGFLDYACLADPGLRKFLKGIPALTKGSRSLIWRRLAGGKEDAAVNAMRIKFGRLDAILHRHVLSGGIPAVVSKYLETGSIPDRHYAEYLGGIVYEWNRTKYGADRLSRCMDFFIHGTGGTITWNGMAKKVGVSNPTVAESYTMALRDMYLALVTHFYDHRHDRADKTMPKKVHVRDPFFFHAFNGWSHIEGYFVRATRYASDEANFGRLVECAMADHLARHAIASSTDKSQFGVPARLFHWRDRTGREVDFVYRVRALRRSRSG